MIRTKEVYELCSPAKIALSTAHSKENQGATIGAVTEYLWSSEVSLSLEKRLKENLFDVKIFDKSQLMLSPKDYSKAYNQNIRDINKWKPDVTLEIHLNSANYLSIDTIGNKTISEHFANYGEYLYFGKSKLFAQFLAEQFKSSFPITPAKQKTRALIKGDNGYHFVKDVNGCCVLAEPFFINKASHFNNIIMQEKILIVDCFYNAIEKYTYNHLK